MMLSDYMALSTCAISIVIVPFLIIAQIRFTHILQTENYNNCNYFKHIKSCFVKVYIPVIIVFIICMFNKYVIQLYLEYTPLFEMNKVYGFLGVVAAFCALISLVYYINVKAIKIESEKKPIKITYKFIAVYLISCVIICIIAVVENVFINLNYIVYITPLLTPLLVPFVNMFTSKKTIMEER